MFYVLNFKNHSFKSLDTAAAVQEYIIGLLIGKTAVKPEDIEIINAFPDGVRYSVSEFKSNFCDA